MGKLKAKINVGTLDLNLPIIEGTVGYPAIDVS
jgi:hypothetical protein